jgi:hypothetical protein
MVKDGLVYLQGTLASQPDSPAAAATVDRVRAAVHAVPGRTPRSAGLRPSTPTWSGTPPATGM